MTAPGSLPFTCDQCGARLLPAEGAACRRCGRVLCASHFALPERGILRLLLRRRGAADPGPVCRACAGPAGPASGAA